ncbi:MAG: hypothetical protein BAJALOKI2v1_580018 [Promethearchaeota archaeon]|nr:MAG: hypothetical protein BAJALOKI2v1_580018 [Candidatus Lokiarchaeota archaeon]
MNNKNGKLDVKFVKCSRCGNPFFLDENSLMHTEENIEEKVCDNCIKLAKRKRKLELDLFDSVVEIENEMEKSINEMKNQLNVSKSTFNKQFFLDKIKKRSEIMTKSIELIEKIEETNDEKYIEEYKTLFEKLKKEHPPI